MRTRRPTHILLRRGVVAVSLTLVTAIGATPPLSAGADPAARGTARDQHRHSHVERGPAGFEKVASRPLPRPRNVPTRPDVSTSAAVGSAPAGATVDLEVLVIAADGTEADLPAIRQALDYLGTPYDEFVAAPAPTDPAVNRFSTPGSGAPALADASLETATNGNYSAVILTTGELGYAGEAGYVSALTPAEWQHLWDYEATFDVRQVSWYTYPTADYGFEPPSAAVDTSTSTIEASFTDAGAGVFGSYANTATPVTIGDAYTYLARPLDDGATTTLLTTDQGDALAAVREHADGRESLALTFDSNANLLHNLVLSYGVVNWATQGLFLGARHVYLGAQVDDLFIDTTLWPPGTPCATSVDDPSLPTYRLTGDDLEAVEEWQAGRQSEAPTAELRLNLAFNGYGTTEAYYDEEYQPEHPDAPSGDTLVEQAEDDEDRFAWISHTYTHANLDDLDAAATADELSSNHVVAEELDLSTYSTASLVQPDVSGLANPAFLDTAYDLGTRYLVSDTSRGGFADNPSPNAGVYNPIQAGLLQVPRRPTNLYFNVSTPEEWLAEDNCLYPAGAFGHVETYDELLERESGVLLTYLLKGDIDPWMFHQSNLRTYDGSRSLLTDLLDRTLDLYTAHFTLPVLSPTMDALGALVAERMRYDGAVVTAAGLAGDPGPSSVSVSAEGATTAPVTGLAIDGAELYGDQLIATVSLDAGGTLTYSSLASVSRQTLTFGQRSLGKTKTKPVLVTSIGELPLVIASITVSGDFTETNGCGTVLAVGQSCSVNVTFAPTATGTRTGSLTVTGGAGNPQLVSLTGTGK